MYHFHIRKKTADTFWTRFVIMWLQIVYSLWYCQPPFIHPLPDRGGFINFFDTGHELPAKRVCSRTSALVEWFLNYFENYFLSNLLAYYLIFELFFFVKIGPIFVSSSFLHFKKPSRFTLNLVTSKIYQILFTKNEFSTTEVMLTLHTTQTMNMDTFSFYEIGGRRLIYIASLKVKVTFNKTNLSSLEFKRKWVSNSLKYIFNVPHVSHVLTLRTSKIIYSSST